MNLFIIIGIVLGAATILIDHLTHKLPQWAAILLFSVAVILVIVGMIISKAQGN